MSDCSVFTVSISGFIFFPHKVFFRRRPLFNPDIPVSSDQSDQKKSSIECSIHPVAANNSFCPSSFFFDLCLVPAISSNNVTIVVNVDRTITPCWLLTLVCSRPSLFFIRLKGLSQFFRISIASWDPLWKVGIGWKLPLSKSMILDFEQLDSKAHSPGAASHPNSWPVDVDPKNCIGISQ